MGGIDLDDSRLCESVCTDELVVRRMECDDDDTDFSCDALGTPAEVAAVKTQATVFGVAATGADEMNALVADTGVGWLAALLEGSRVYCENRLFFLATGKILTSSFGRKRVWHLLLTACGGSRGKYPCLRGWKGLWK